MDSLAFLKSSGPVGPLYVLFGDEPFLKRQVREALKARALGEGADEQAISSHEGETATFAGVFDELQTVPFFAPRRVVVVDEADPFVTKHRPQLEKAVGMLPASGVLILDVKTWPSSTRLAKMVDASATIVCKTPEDYRLTAWCAEWAQTRHQKQLTKPGAELLVGLVGPEMGLLDQEILKLAIYVGDRKRIEEEDVDRLVGHSRAESAFEILRAIGEGKAAEALTILDRSLDQGEEPFKIMGALGWQLRQLAQATRLVAQGTQLRSALSQVGVRFNHLDNAERQLKHLTRRRALRLYDWLMEVHMDLRGNSPLPKPAVLERFLLKLALPEKNQVT